MKYGIIKIFIKLKCIVYSDRSRGRIKFILVASGTKMADLKKSSNSFFFYWITRKKSSCKFIIKDKLFFSRIDEVIVDSLLPKILSKHQKDNY